MVQSKIEIYTKGTACQKRRDIVIDLRRPDVKKMAKWTPEQKANAIKHVEFMEIVFKNFVEAIKTA